MDKKTLTITGVILAVIVILVFVVIGMQATNKGLSSEDILRINNEIYTKKEFNDFIRYRLYKNNGELKVDEEQYKDDLSNGVSKEKIFVTDSLNEFYKAKVFSILANQKNIVVSGDELTQIEEDYTTNEETITAMGVSKDDYIKFEREQAIVTKITNSPNDYLELPDEMYDNYLKQLSGDELKSYTYRMFQVGYTDDTVNESGETVSGDKIEKQEYMQAIVDRIKDGVPFEEAAESGDSRIIYVGNGIQFEKSMEEHSAGVLLEQKLGSEELAEAAKKTAEGEMTEIIDSSNAFQVAKIEKVEDGIVGEAKDELIELLISSASNDLVYSVVKDMEVNQSAVSRIKIK